MSVEPILMRNKFDHMSGHEGELNLKRMAWLRQYRKCGKTIKKIHEAIELGRMFSGRYWSGRGEWDENGEWCSEEGLFSRRSGKSMMQDIVRRLDREYDREEQARAERTRRSLR